MTNDGLLPGFAVQLVESNMRRTMTLRRAARPQSPAWSALVASPIVYRPTGSSAARLNKPIDNTPMAARTS